MAQRRGLSPLPELFSSSGGLRKNKRKQKNCNCFCTFACSFPPAEGLFLRFRLRGTKEPRPITRTQVWARAELRGERSEHPQSRTLALFQGPALLLAEPRRTIETHNFSSIFSLYCGCLLLFYLNYTAVSEINFEAAAAQQSHFKVYLVTITNGASIMCARVCYPDEDSLDDCNPHFL